MISHVTHLTYPAFVGILVVFCQSQIRKNAYAAGSFWDDPAPHLWRGKDTASTARFCPSELVGPVARTGATRLYERSCRQHMEYTIRIRQWNYTKLPEKIGVLMGSAGDGRHVRRMGSSFRRLLYACVLLVRFRGHPCRCAPRRSVPLTIFAIRMARDRRKNSRIISKPPATTTSGLPNATPRGAIPPAQDIKLQATPSNGLTTLTPV